MNANAADDFSERARAAVRDAVKDAGYGTPPDIDRRAIADVLYAPIAGAIAERPADRPKVLIHRPRLTGIAFPNVAGPREWADEEDPELAEEVYRRIDGRLVWRLTATAPGGPLQSRLNGDARLWLCRFGATVSAPEGVYVTRDLACLMLDYVGPGAEAVVQEGKKFHEGVGALIDRLPEHAAPLSRKVKLTFHIATTNAEMGMQAVLDTAELSAESQQQADARPLRVRPDSSDSTGVDEDTEDDPGDGDD